MGALTLLVMFAPAGAVSISPECHRIGTGLWTLHITLHGFGICMLERGHDSFAME